MKPVYREVLADFDRRIAHMQGVRDQVAAIAEANDNAVLPSRTRYGHGPATKGRTKVGGGDQVVLDVIRDGANTLPKIVEEAKVKLGAARAAIKRLRKAGRVQMNGTRRHATYEVARKKR